MPRVLVVDDIVTDRLLAGNLFERVPEWEVSYANDGQEALNAIRNEQPDAVVTDLMMPELNGLELVRVVTQEYPLIPVVLMTSKGSEEVAVEALQSGAASYVPKRILTRDLLRIVERVLATSQAEQTHAELMNYVNRVESVQLKSDLSLISSLVHHLGRAFTSFGICDHRNSMRVSTALDEALSNALYHGNLEIDSRLREVNNSRYYELAQQRCEELPYRDRCIHVRAHFTHSNAVVSIRDEGKGFDPSRLPDPTDPENMCRPYGRGVMLMRTFMDDVAFNSDGNEVTLTKRCDA